MITKEQVLKLAPRPKQQYIDCFDHPEVLDTFEINTSLRIAHFMAQILHESGGFSILTESLNYSTPERLMAVWPSRFPTRESALPFVHNQAGLAEKVYGGRMGNPPGKAFLYIGRGPLQLTGHDSYKEIGNLLGLDLVNNPDLAITAPYMLQIAACEWKKSRCNEAADEDNLLHVSGRINVGHDVSSPKSIVGYTERAAWLYKVKTVLKGA
jgi:putative chitinase